LALSLGAVAAGVMNGKPGGASLANSWMASKRCNQFCRAYRPARRSWPLRQSAGRCRLQSGGKQPGDTAFWLAATRAGALEVIRSQGLDQPNVAAGPTLPARQTCAPPTVRRALQLAMRGLQPRELSGLAPGDAGGGIRKHEG